MKKILLGLAALSLAGGAAGIAHADEVPTPIGTLHAGQTGDGEVYVVGEGNGSETPDGYVGVESNDGVVAACNDDDPNGEYVAGEGIAVNVPPAAEQPSCIG